MAATCAPAIFVPPPFLALSRFADQYPVLVVNLMKLNIILSFDI